MRNRFALPETCVRILGTLGDVDGPQNGGGIVWLHRDGHAVIEYACGRIDEEEWMDDADPLVIVHMATVDDADLRTEYEWVDWKELEQHMLNEDESIDELLSSKDLMDKAFVVWLIGEYYGWNEIDPYPLWYAAQELYARWYGDELSDEDKQMIELRHIADKFGDYSYPNIERFYRLGVVTHVDAFIKECEEILNTRSLLSDEERDVKRLIEYAKFLAKED